MPTRADVLGFGNNWYQPAFDTAIEAALPSGRRINMVTAPYFLATKLAAFDGRGAGDYVMSHDMEDVAAVLDGRPEVVDEIKESDEPLRRHLEARFAALLRDSKFIAALPGHLPGDAASQLRLPLILRRIEDISE
jgi:hypothetical protein